MLGWWNRIGGSESRTDHTAKSAWSADREIAGRDGGELVGGLAEAHYVYRPVGRATLV